MPPRILIVDDDADASEALALFLERSGFSVRRESRPESAAAAAVESRAELVLSDVCMPTMSGLTLCRRLKSDRRTAGAAVVLYSGRRKGELEQSEALEAGADDYILKPCAPALIVARLRAVLRRRQGEPRPVLKAAGLALDLEARLATAGGRALELTRKEFDLLAALLAKSGRVLAAPFLLETIWGYDSAVYKDAHTVEVHVSSLRRKLGRRHARRIVTVPGLGYRFDR